MRIVEVTALDNGAHRNQSTGGAVLPPNGWAVIPDSVACENFPFGEVEAEEVNGVMTITKWTAGVMPEPVPMLEELSVWDELDAAYREGVNSI